MTSGAAYGGYVEQTRWHAVARQNPIIFAGPVAGFWGEVCYGNSLRSKALDVTEDLAAVKLPN